mmetsp:Transcript_88409/g.171222  ORF Transcript_88409/g.171222 Transcript_88409/m.171222 type:complete len:209 (+) Transcript_88409:818-1444(+)
MGRALKRVLPRQHLVHQQPQAPPVHHAPVPALQKHFRRHVLLGAAVAARRFRRRHRGVRQTPRRGWRRRLHSSTGTASSSVALLLLLLLLLVGDPDGVVQGGGQVFGQSGPLVERAAQPKVRQLHVPLPVHQHVFGLQVSVHHLELVQVLQRERDLAHVQLHPALLELPELAHEGEEVAALHEVHHHVQLLLVLERVAELHDVGVPHA